jgi:alkylation response protein AidB-like acyl-CoA dehydrogenase
MAVLTEEQVMVRDAARAWVQAQSPVSAFRRIRDAGAPLGFDPAHWQAMAGLGWAGVVTPEAYAGSQLGYQTLGLILEQAGRTLTASPLLATTAAAGALILGGDEAQKAAYLPSLATGETLAALAVDEEPHHRPEQIGLRAQPTAGGYALTGTKRFVLEGAAADLLVVAARTAGAPADADGVALFLAPAETPGVERRPLRLADGRGAADITFRSAWVSRDAMIGEPARGRALLDSVLDRARAAACAEMLGVASQAFDMTLDYLKTREQFGQVIGAFQALQHRASRMFCELELARSCVEAALQACDAAEAAQAASLVSVAKAKMGDALFLVSNELIQMHGGIGMTDAYDAGLYLKRARSLEATFGNRAYHRDRFARLSGF